MHQVTTQTPRTADDRRFSRSSRLTPARALAVALAATALAACGPRDAPTAPMFGTAPATAASTTVVAPMQAQPDPAVSVRPVAMAADRPAQPASVYRDVPAPTTVARNDGHEPQPAPSYAQPSQYAPSPRPVQVQQRAPVAENRIGSVESIEPIHTRPQGSGAGAVIGGVLGGVLGNRFGSGNGRAAMTGIGAVGGAIAGNNVERNYKENIVGYRVHVRLDNGSTRTFQRSQLGNLRVGDRVRVDSSSGFHRV